jgi:hypothetical protein
MVWLGGLMEGQKNKKLTAQPLLEVRSYENSGEEFYFVRMRVVEKSI